MVEDYARSYEIDGIMWGSERQGAFANPSAPATAAAPASPASRASASIASGRRATRGVDPARARAGFQALGEFCRRSRQGKRPVDGFYVRVWRLMLRYPELLAWEMLWTDSLRETYEAIYNEGEGDQAFIGVGWHIWHNNSFNPIYRAEQDLSEISRTPTFSRW